MSAERVAVVLFNLGGPKDQAAVRPFLRNLFADPEIIAAPQPWRGLLAEVISRSRAGAARTNYARMGGGSPLLANTYAQAAALEAALARRAPGIEARVFVAMRYASPRAEEAARAVDEFAPRRVALAPLYPQYSAATSGSSLREWLRIYKGGGTIHGLCCWPSLAGLAQAHADAVMAAWSAAGRPPVRLLFSAHGLPKRAAERGDPYRWQVEQTCAAVAARLPGAWDWRLSFQSRVGPLEWLRPYTAEEIVAAGRAGLGVLVDPIAFVSEHVETLVELDRDYRRLAERAGAPVYLRAATPGTAASFVDGLARAIVEALEKPGVGPGGAPCPADWRRCWLKEAAPVAAGA